MHADLVETIRLVLGVAESQSMKPILVGGLASELATWTLKNPPPARVTYDADFAIRMDTWNQFNSLKDGLVGKGFNPDLHIEHRLELGKTIVDILPYGPGIASGEKVQWPRAGQSLTITGFEEACAHPVESVLGADLRVRHVTVPGLALLKIMAFLDRKQKGDPKHKHDAGDLRYWMKNHATEADEGRRYDLVQHGITDVEFTEAGAAILGMDVSDLASESAHKKVGAFLVGCDDEFGQFVEALITPGFDEDRLVLAKLGHAFLVGYQAARRTGK